MQEPKPSPIRPTDDEARSVARELISNATFAALAVQDQDGTPGISRVAFGLGSRGEMLTLVSDLSAHAARLRRNPRCALLLGEPPAKGDPLAFARISLTAQASFIARSDPRHISHREAWLSHHPKAALYVDFGDFHFIEFEVKGADLNGGFGKAFRLTPHDLLVP